jgi:hypothetical protein
MTNGFINVRRPRRDGSGEVDGAEPDPPIAIINRPQAGRHTRLETQLGVGDKQLSGATRRKYPNQISKNQPRTRIDARQRRATKLGMQSIPTRAPTRANITRFVEDSCAISAWRH